jgi:hypothetical protein
MTQPEIRNQILQNTGYASLPARGVALLVIAPNCYDRALEAMGVQLKGTDRDYLSYFNRVK